MRNLIQICTVLSLVFLTGTMAHARLRSPSVSVQIATSTVKDVVISGNRRIPTDRIRSELQTKTGDLVNLSTVSRDIRALYSLGYFDDVQVGTENASNGLTIVFSVKEKPLVREIQYKGVHSVTITEIEKVLALSQKGFFLTHPIPYRKRRRRQQF